MKKDNILLLEKRGCDFWHDDNTTKTSDVGNYRVCTTGEVIEGKNSKKYSFEFTQYQRYNYRKNHKITGKPLKHAIKELKNINALGFNNQYTNDKGSWGDVELMNKIYSMELSYTKADILKAVNFISKKQYSKIIFVDDIKKAAAAVAGWREKNILNNLKDIKIIQNDSNYLVYKFTAIDGASFEYEANQNIICG